MEPIVGAAPLTLEPYHSLPVQIRAWDPRVREVAARLIATVEHAARAALPRASAAHIGSTAVPDMPGKGYVDLHLPVPPALLAEVVRVLLESGWQRQTSPWPFPETRPVLRASVTLDGVRYQAHLHVIPDDSPEIGAQLAFREALRSDPALRARYADRKHELVGAGVTRGREYAEAKGDVIAEALRALGSPRP